MQGFIIGEYCAVPYGKRGYIIIHKGSQMEKICRTEGSARKYINELKK